jgi:hypothetical protein
LRDPECARRADKAPCARQRDESAQPIDVHGSIPTIRDPYCPYADPCAFRIAVAS